jgi:hypothetical protein
MRANGKPLGPFKFWLYIAFLSLVALGKKANAAEIRMLTEMPSTNQTTPRDIAKNKAQGWKCNKVRLSDTSGNAVNVKGSKPRWFSSIPTSQDDQAETLLSDGKTAIKCVLQARIDGRMRNAETDSND